MAAIALAFCLYAAPAGAMTPEQVVVSKLGGDTILNTKPEKLVTAVHDCSKEYPERSLGFVQSVLMGGRADADAIAPQVVVAAIEGLGENPSASIVGDIVYFSVKATPAVVLEIVKASVRAAPSCANAIVKAAARAVPKPKAGMEVIGETLSTSGTTSDATGTDSGNGYGKDDKVVKDPKDKDLLPIGGVGTPSTPEAIARAAMQGDPSLSYTELLSSAKGGGGGGGNPPPGDPPILPPPLPRPPAGATPPVVSR